MRGHDDAQLLALGEVGTSKRAREYLATFGDDVVILVENHGSMLENGGRGKDAGTHDHRVRLAKPIVFTGDQDTDRATGP